MKNIIGAAVVAGLSLVGALAVGCGSEGGATGGVAQEQAAVVAVATLGPGAACSTASTAEKCETGFYCAVSETLGVCSTTGVCTAKPVRCSEAVEVGGVCGCDGKSYGNGCFAQSAGTSVAHSGPCTCETKGTSLATGACANGYYCKATVSSTDVCSATGTCVADGPCPDDCVLNHETFCGCDGVTHTACNACLARTIYGTTIAYAGACK